MSLTRFSLRPRLVVAASLCMLGFYIVFDQKQGLFANEGIPISADPPAVRDTIIERGEYLAIAGNCATCHTAADGIAYAGGLPFKTDFGTIYSTNITQDPETGIGNWTEEQFEQALRKGIRADGSRLYPAFPYPSFTKIADEDVSALYAYFQTLPAVEAPNKKNEMSFPFNQRWLMAGWNMLFFDEGAYRADPEQSDQWNRGAYLVEGLAHCAACHTPRNFLGGPVKSSPQSGGLYSDMVPTGDYRDWFAPNLTSAASGLQSWSVDHLTDYLATGRSEHHISFGPMNKVIMNSTSLLSKVDQRAMAVYLKSLPAIEHEVVQDLSEQELGRAQTIYDLHCGTCHAPTGLGAPETGARLVGSPVVQATDPSSLINVILYGPELSNPTPPLGEWRPMPGFNDKIRDEEVALLASYMRQMWGNMGGRVTADQVAKQRPPYN